MSKYGAIPQAGADGPPTDYQVAGEQPQYAQPPPQYSDPYGGENQPQALHQPVNNSFGSQQQDLYQQQPGPGVDGGYGAPQYQQPHIQQQPGYGATQYQNPPANPHYNPTSYAPAPPVMQQQQSSTVSVSVTEWSLGVR
jgi:hypothetical protein